MKTQEYQSFDPAEKPRIHVTASDGMTYVYRYGFDSWTATSFLTQFSPMTMQQLAGQVSIPGSGKIKDQIASARKGKGLSDADESRLYCETLIEPTTGIKRITKTKKGEGYSFDKAELGATLDELDQAAAFSNVELDDA